MPLTNPDEVAKITSEYAEQLSRQVSKQSYFSNPLFSDEKEKEVAEQKLDADLLSEEDDNK